MADITSSLFPETQGLLQQQQQNAYTQAANLAQGGYANAALAAGMGAGAQYGQQTGQALNALFGIKSQDQQEAEATKAIADELIKQGYKLQSYQGMTKLAEGLNNKSLYNAAGKAMAAASVLQKQEAELQKTQAETGFKQAETAYKGTQSAKIQLDYSKEEVAKTTARAALKAQGVAADQIEAIINNPKARESYLKQVDEKTQTVEAGGKVLLIDKTDGSVVATLGAAPERGTKIVMPSQEGAQALSFTTAAQAAVKPYTEAIDAADRTLTLLDNAFTGKNPQSYTQAIVGLASIIQGGKISNQDVSRAGGDPAVFNTIKDYVSGKLTGLPSVETGRNIYATAKLLRQIAENKRNGVIKDQQRIAQANKMDPAIIEKLFQAPSPYTNAPAAAAGTRTTKSGVSYTIEGQ